jgi:hypothetical protein
VSRDGVRSDTRSSVRLRISRMDFEWPDNMVYAVACWGVCQLVVPPHALSLCAAPRTAGSLIWLRPPPLSARFGKCHQSSPLIGPKAGARNPLARGFQPRCAHPLARFGASESALGTAGLGLLRSRRALPPIVPHFVNRQQNNQPADDHRIGDRRPRRHDENQRRH